MPRKILAILLFYITTVCMCYSQEICNNGIDDDGDGLIDLNDEECECASLLPSSLIPNPSFEQRTCCPTMNAQLDCAIGWIQASAATTDYVHTCGGYLGNTSIPAFAPLPFPEGEGGVGFRDGQENAGPGYKEYVGTCLIEPMKEGTKYRLEFYVGFRDNFQGNTSLDIAIFGAESCSALPFGNNNTQVGCPANTAFYDEIDIQFVSGSNEWVKVIFEFVPTKNYRVIVIGPSCAANPNYIFSPYFYLDGLTLAADSEFGLPFEGISGSICEEGIVLSVEDAANQSYQWYKDGIALIGETESEINIISAPDAEGEYSAIINLPDGCISSQTYSVSISPYFTALEKTICEGETFILGGTGFTEAGTHEITVLASDGCDSIITLELSVEGNTTFFIEDSFCEGEEYSFLDITTSTPGAYETILPNSKGCDSIITLELTEILNLVGIILPPDINSELGDLISISPLEFDERLTEFVWYNEENEVIANSKDLIDYQSLENSILTMVGSDQFGCTVQESIAIEVDQSNLTIHIPNIFSPDDNQINDLFSFIPTKAVSSIESFTIYDRWGNQVFSDKPATDFNDRLGWDGTINGQYAEQGVYSYIIEATFLNGTNKVFVGNLTLIRF